MRAIDSQSSELRTAALKATAESSSSGETERKTTVSVLSFSQDCLTDITVERIPQLAPIVGHCSAVWIDVEGLEDRRLVRELLALVEADSSIKDLVYQEHRTPIYQMHGKDFFFTFHWLDGTSNFELRQVSILQVANTVITFHQSEIPEIDRIKADVRRQHSLLDSNGRLYMVQRCLEAAIDCFQPILDNHSIELEKLEEAIVDDPQRETMQEIHLSRKELITLKRILLPMKICLRRFQRDMSYYADKRDLQVAQELLQNCSDTLDMVEYFISVTSDLMSLHMSSVSNRMNEVMTVLAIVAAIFLPPTLIAGIYGMNFYNKPSPWNMPEVSWELGYPFALVMMSAISLAFLLFFWWNGWLKVFQLRKRQ